MEIANLICRLRRSDSYCVTEIGTLEPGFVDLPLALFRPTVAVVTHIGTDHFRAFHSLDAIAEEKGKLVGALPPDGVAILNADDPRVLAMRSRFAGRIVTYGVAADAMVQGSQITASWPDRLALTVKWNGHSMRVQTRLCGAHWISAVLAAIATGVALGVPLDAALKAIARVEPFEGRMQPVELEDGVTFIRDDWKASWWTLESTIEFMQQARAARKIIVFGTISDYPGDAGRHYVNAARQALTVADTVVFIGPHASSALRAKRDPSDRLLAFSSPRQAASYFAGYLRAGDLVLLKGSIPADHLQRQILVRTTDVRCWRLDCRRRHFCGSCELLRVPSGPTGTDVPVGVSHIPAPRLRGGLVSGHPAVACVVGLGNPGVQYADTPHNVGQRALEALAQRFARSWAAENDEFMIARAQIGATLVCLLKPVIAMNDVGPALVRLAQVIGFGAAQCVLLQDDADLPLGTVRTRMRGADGGHRGVRSILEAFQDDRFRRVKIGVGRSATGASALDHVLTNFSVEQLARVDEACLLAADRIVELLKVEAKPKGTDSFTEPCLPRTTS
jgi:aminoacyl-tRNA hydrolase